MPQTNEFTLEKYDENVHTWSRAITTGDLKMAQWLYANYKQKCHIWKIITWYAVDSPAAYRDSTMDTAIEHKQFEIIKWLYSIKTKY